MHISYAGAISCGAKLARVLLVFTISQKQLQASRQQRNTRVGSTAATFAIYIFGEKSAEVERELQRGRRRVSVSARQVTCVMG